MPLDSRHVFIDKYEPQKNPNELLLCLADGSRPQQKHTCIITHIRTLYNTKKIFL